MNHLASYIVGVALASLIVGPASAQHISSNVVGVDDTRHFYQLCLQTAPSFSGAERRKKGISFVRVGDIARDPVKEDKRLRTHPYDSLRLVETDTSCSCTLSFVYGDQFVQNALNNFYVTVEQEFMPSFKSGIQVPVRMSFEFDGVPTEVTASRDQIRPQISQISFIATRDGNCPT